MTIERRDFLMTAMSGLAFPFGNPKALSAQHSRGSSRGSLHLEGRLKAGTLKLQARDFLEGAARALIMNGELEGVDLYCALFTDRDHTVFAILRTDDHSTSLVLSDTEDRNIARLMVWNNKEAPEVVRIDKEKFIDTLNVNQSIVGPKGTVDLLGKRRPPEFTAQELESVFGKDPALLAFTPDRKYPRARSDFFCGFLSIIPGSLFTLGWEGGY